MKKIIYTLLFLVFAIATIDTSFAAKNVLQPKLAISPPRIEMQVDDKATESITVLNMGDSPMQVVVNVQNWDLDEQNKFRPLAPTEQSLDQWLVINPVRLEIPAKSQQTVRMAIRPRTTPEAGEHRAMVFFTEQPQAGKQGQINFKVGVPVYGYFGETQRTAVLNSVSYDDSNNEIIFDVSNTGNAYVRPEGVYVAVKASEVKNEQNLLASMDMQSNKYSGREILAYEKLSSQPVLAQQQRRLNNKVRFLQKTTPQEPYVVAVKAMVADTLVEKIFRVNPK